MKKSFRDMTPEERADVRSSMLKIPVTSKEVTSFDPMIHRLVKQEILKYWGNGLRVYSGDVIIGRLGMSFDDLMQYGRMLVCNQIRWFKSRGVNPDTGKPWNAKMTTLIHQQLRNKFMSLSKSFASEKNGGQIVNVSENKKLINDYLCNVFSVDASLEENKSALARVLVDCSKDTQRRCCRNYKSNEEIQACLHTILASMDAISHVSYEDIEGFAATSSGLNPEEALLVKEEINLRMKKICEKKGGPVGLDDLCVQRKCTHPKFFPKGTSTVLMSMARASGIQSQKELAEQLGVGMTTLSNILRGRSNGTDDFRKCLEARFGKTLEELITVVEE